MARYRESVRVSVRTVRRALLKDFASVAKSTRQNSADDYPECAESARVFSRVDVVLLILRLAHFATSSTLVMLSRTVSGRPFLSITLRMRTRESCFFIS